MSDREDVTAKEVQQFAELARAFGSGQLETLLAKKNEIISLDFAALEKLSVPLRATAANNGVCGLGCGRGARTTE